MIDQERPTPISDDVLIRFLDGEADSDEVARVEAARGDGGTEARLSELRRAGALFSTAAAAIPTPPLPPLARPGTFRPARAAAVALLLATGAAAAVPATRTLLVHGLGAALSWVSGGGAPGPVGQPTASGSASVGVPLTGPDFLLDFEGTWAGAKVRIERGDGSEVQVTTSGAELLVLPGGIRLRPGREASAEVTVRAPAGLRRLRVMHRGAERVVDLLDPQLPRTLELGPPGR